MPTKRPDQLPDGEDFDFEDILMVEKDPETSERKLYKSTLREFMDAALKIDPERMGSNAIVGMQSKFEWLIEQMEKIEASSLIDVDSYKDFDSPTKELEESYTTPTPTPTPSITPTISATPADPNQPQPSPSVTPTPTSTPQSLTKELEVELNDFHVQILELPPQFLPEVHQYSTWRIKPGQDTDNVYTIFSGFFPNSFQPSVLKERLLTLKKISETQLKIETALIDDFGQIFSIQGLKNGSTIKFTIILS